MIQKQCIRCGKPITSYKYCDVCRENVHREKSKAYYHNLPIEKKKELCRGNPEYYFKIYKNIKIVKNRLNNAGREFTLRSVMTSKDFVGIEYYERGNDYITVRMETYVLDGDYYISLDGRRLDNPTYLIKVKVKNK